MTHSSPARRSLHALCLLAALAPLAAFAVDAAPAESEYGTNRAPVQVFYVPLPEEHVHSALRSIWGDYKTGTSMFGAPGSPMESYVSVAIFLDNTVIYYDQWEDGYERDIANPNHPWSAAEPFGTQIWGDGDPSNGSAPGFPADRLYSGDIIELHSSVALDRIGQAVYFDGCDKFGATKPIAATRTLWASESKTLFAGANEMYDTLFFGDEFVCPVGENIAATDQYEIFEYVGLSVMAGPGGATIQVDKDNNGSFDVLEGGATSLKLVEGEPYLVDGGVKLGGRVVATEGSVQVELVTGDVFDGYESRFMKLLPRNLWSTSYTCPVAAPLSANNSVCGSKIWIYNPGSSRLTVTCKSTAKTQTVTVEPRSYRFVIPAPKPSSTSFGKSGSSLSADLIYTGALSGTHLTANAPFYALCTVDCIGTTASTTKSAGLNRTWDWGFALVPEASLSSQVVVGLGLGRDPTSTVNPNENAAPIWVTAPVIADGKSSTTVHYQLADGTQGAKTLSALQSLTLYGNGNQTGMRVWTEDGTKLAAAWGSDPAKATAGQPGLDMGTGIPPMPEIFMQKSSRLAVDPDGDSFTAGDTIEYTVEIMNVGHVLINDITLKDTLPEGVAYVPGSFSVRTVEGTREFSERAIADSYFAQVVSPAGLKVSDEWATSDQILYPSQSWVYRYRVSIDASARGTLRNVAIVNSGVASLTNSVVDHLRASVGDRVWFDADGDGVQDAGEIGLPYATVALVDAETGYQVTDDFDRPYLTVTDDTGAYLFKGIRPGNYRVVVSVPAAYAPTVPGAVSNLSETDSDIGQAAVDGFYSTAAFALQGGDARRDVDAGFVVRDNAAISLVKTAGNAADGDTLEVEKGDRVTYTFRFTNTGDTYLKDVTVTDDKLPDWSFVFDGVLAPGETSVATATAVIRRNVTNVGTVVGTPTDAYGHDLPGILGAVWDDDDAVVTVPPEPATIGDRVWADVDGDGFQDEGEPGLSDVTVTLKDSDGNVVASMTTDANGEYLFEDVPAGTYTVVFTSPDSVYEFTAKDAGSDDASDSDANGAGLVTVTVAPGASDLSIDAGLKLRSGAAAIDLVKTAGDAPDGADFQLARYGDTATYTYKVTNTGLAPLINVVVTDDKLGRIGTIPALAPGASATLTASAALITTTTNIATVVGTPTTKAGDALPGVPMVTDFDDAVVIVPLQTATIGDRVWIDADGDGIQDANEVGLHGVTVTLKDANGSVVATQTTDGNGNYLFTDVVPGAYTVVFTAPASYWTFTTKDAGADDADSDANGAGVASVTVAPGATDLTIDAGLKLANGAAAIDIVKTAGNAADGATLRTDAIGANVTYTYKVTNTGRTHLKNVVVADDKLGTIGTLAGILAPGESATLTKTAAISVDTTNVGTVTGTPADANGDPIPGTSNVTAKDDAVVDVPDEPASIGDRAWIDLDGDGVQDAGEPGLPGVTVTLKDATGAVVATTKTDANGNYLFTDVAPGDYTVTFAPAEAWWNVTAKDAGNNDAADSDINAAGVTGTFTLVSLADDLTRDAGFVFNSDVASLSIVKTASQNAVDKGKPVTYTYDVSNTGSTHLKDVTVTDDRLGVIGTIALLAPGASQTLTMTAVLTEDTTNIGTATGTPADASGTPIPGAEDVTAEDEATVAVNADPATIGDRVWNDVDGDGVQDEGEMGVYGIVVHLLREDGTVVATTTTDANGNYLFTDVESGTYVVEFAFASDSGWTFTAKDAGADDAADSDADPATGRTAPFDVAAGETNVTLDAGLVGGVPPGICDWTEISSKFNAFIGGDFRAEGGDSEGNLFVTGDANVGMGFSVGLIGPGYGRTRNAAPLGTDAFVVAGDLHETTQPDINGNIVYGGSYRNETNMLFDARPYDLRHVPTVTFDADWNVPVDASGRTVASVRAGLDSFSAVVAALKERGDPQYVGPVAEPYDPNLVWTAGDPFRSVFVIINDTFALTSASLKIHVPEGTKAVVNILARDVNISWASIALIGTDPTKVLYNFPNATNIVVNGCNFEGSVFAPKANAWFNGAAVNGFAYFGGNVVFVNGAEFHDFAFKAFDCSPYFAMRPTMRLTVTAGDAADGAVLAAVAGESVVLTEVVENTGDYALSDVTLVDVLGRRLSVGDLAAGASATYQVVVTADAATTYRATATGTSLDAEAAPYLGTTISASGAASIEVFATAEARKAEMEARLAANVRASGGYRPRPDLEVLSIEFEGGAPTLTNETFAVRVRVANSGEIATRTGRLSAYVGASAPVAPGTPATVSVNLRGTAYETLLPGESFEYVFTGLRTPAEGGACHVRVLADADGVIEELSEGNNQLPAFAWLTPITLETAIDAEGVLLAWNCYDGQTYTILVSPLLATTREPFTGVVEILDADGDVAEVTDGLAIPADPSGTLSIRIPTTENDVSGFFSLRVNILDDDSDVR